MSNIDQRLAELGITLPQPAAPVASYVPFVEVNGLMREDYFLYAEEVEWCLRAKRRGLRLGLAPAARILHVRPTPNRTR